MKPRLLLVLLCCLMLGLVAACSQQTGQSAQGSASSNTAIDAREAAERQKLFTAYQSVLKAGNQPTALGMGKTLQRRWPNSVEAKAVAAQVAALEKTVAAANESERLANLWVYHRLGAEGDSAFIYRNGDGDQVRGGRGIRLVLRDKPDWGRDIFLLTAVGRFDCAPACKVELSIDGKAPIKLDAFASEPDQNPAMFFKDTEGFLKILRAVKTLDVQAPMQDDPDNRARFEVGGYVESKWLGVSASSGAD